MIEEAEESGEEKGELVVVVGDEVGEKEREVGDEEVDEREVEEDDVVVDDPARLGSNVVPPPSLFRPLLAPFLAPLLVPLLPRRPSTSRRSPRPPGPVRNGGPYGM